MEHHLKEILARLPETLVVRDAAIPRPLPEALQLLHNAVSSQALPLELPPDTITAIVRHDPQDDTQWCLGRIAEWSQPRYALDKRFVYLTLLMDRGEAEAGPRWERRQPFRDLREVLAAVDDPALVLLGPPGSGKSTLLRRLELDLAVAALGGGPAPAPLTFFIPLNQYKPDRPGGALPAPGDWLARRWRQRYGHLPDLEQLLRQRRLILLLDALNEMPQGGTLRPWKDFIQHLAQDWPGNRVVFSCRSLDYSAPLSTPELRVPQVQLETLNDAQVREFVMAYRPEQGEALWQRLAGSPQLDLVRTPYYLKLLVDQAPATGELPPGHAALFTGFVRQALKRELERDNPLFQSPDLLDQRERQRIHQVTHWPDPCELPHRGALFPGLSALAHRMQERGQTDQATQVRVGYDEALELLDHAQAETLLKAGEALGVLEEDLGRDEVLFLHQLLQEYFAARHLACHPQPQRVATPWRADAMAEPLADTLARLADSDPLPAAPVTGWEETAVLAGAMVQEADAYIQGLMDANLPVAGRCAAQPDVTVSDALTARLQQALIQRTEDPAADLRARIAAGRALGELGDPRFERHKGAIGDYLLPPMVEIPGGRYRIGSDEDDNEKPAHEVELAPFALGQFPVTNAEWALFMAAGGYDDERWWDTDAGRAWRRGEGTDQGPKREVRDFRKTLQENFDQIRTLHQQGRITSQQAEEWEQIARWTDDEFEDWLKEKFPGGRYTQPDFWEDDAYNHPAQPVVGICWYEARAYCAWLAVQTGQSFRLPTEAEWEAAARGRSGRRYAYGNEFDPTRCNTFETHVRGTTPIGVFPGGKTPDTGLVDLTGNTWDWTGSLRRPYPYRADDGREDPETGDEPRVVRGGSWNLDQVLARAAVRLDFGPAGRDSSLGLRLCRPSPI